MVRVAPAGEAQLAIRHPQLRGAWSPRGSWLLGHVEEVAGQPTFLRAGAAAVEARGTARLDAAGTLQLCLAQRDLRPRRASSTTLTCSPVLQAHPAHRPMDIAGNSTEGLQRR